MRPGTRAAGSRGEPRTQDWVNIMSRGPKRNILHRYNGGGRCGPGKEQERKDI